MAPVASRLDRSSQTLPALGWLLELQALADVLVGVYRRLDLDPAWIDVVMIRASRRGFSGARPA